MDTGRNNVVTALPHVHVIVGMNLQTTALAGEVGDDLVRVHVRTGARPRLEDIDWKMLVVRPCGNLERRFLNRCRQV